MEIDAELTKRANRLDVEYRSKQRQETEEPDVPEEGELKVKQNAVDTEKKVRSSGVITYQWWTSATTTRREKKSTIYKTYRRTKTNTVTAKDPEKTRVRASMSQRQHEPPRKVTNSFLTNLLVGGV